jgi:hypothetical protein
VISIPVYVSARGILDKLFYSSDPRSEAFCTILTKFVQSPLILLSYINMNTKILEIENLDKAIISLLRTPLEWGLSLVYFLYRNPSRPNPPPSHSRLTHSLSRSPKSPQIPRIELYAYMSQRLRIMGLLALLQDFGKSRRHFLCRMNIKFLAAWPSHFPFLIQYSESAKWM